jgi:ABC-2 type transport system permease protein
VVSPIFQILLFVYIGRSAGVQSDEFFVIGNAVQYASIPCLFSMTHAIAGERYQQTLAYILVSPAGRLPLFLGRALPVVVNAWVVSVFSLLVTGLIFGIDVPSSAWPAIALVILIASFSCTGLGLVCAAVGLRVRETAVLNNVIFGLLLVFSGANVPIAEFPGWMQAISNSVPLTHGIEAAREVAEGASFGDVSGLIATEFAIGVVYTVVGYQMLRVMEYASRRRASIQIA